MYKSLDEFKFRPDLTSDYRINCTCVSKNYFFHFFLFAVDMLLFKPVCNEDIHSILDEIKFQPDWTSDCGVSCP